MKPRFLPPAVVAAIASFALAAAISPIQAQEEMPAGDRHMIHVDRACATPEPTLEEMGQVQKAVDQWLLRYGANAVGGQIKVAFHVIYSGSEGNIPQSQIDAQISYLNSSYNGTGYSFLLASVSRTNSKRWFKMTPGTGAETQAKNALAVDPAHRLNIYTCKPGQNLLGWAYFPWSFAESDKRHGVVIHYGSVPGGYLSPYNLGGTATHEVGHYLGLYHTFQNGCNAPGDYVDDTPYEATPTSGCPNGKDTCPSAGLDPIHNYMDYSTDACYTNFTAGQDVRMDGIVPVYRPSLLDAALVAEDRSIGKPGADPLAGNELNPANARLGFRGAFPNPFGVRTAIRYFLPRSQQVSLRIYNVAGQKVQTLVDGVVEAGEHTTVFQPRGLPSGTYFAQLRSGGGEEVTRTVIFVK